MTINKPHPQLIKYVTVRELNYAGCNLRTIFMEGFGDLFNAMCL